MVNYLKMDLYRLGRSRWLWAALLADAVTTAAPLLILVLGIRFYPQLAAMGGEDPQSIQAVMSSIGDMSSTARDTLGKGFPNDWVNLLLILAAALYLREEAKCGYFRNIAALHPTRLGLVLSKTAVIAVMALALQAVYGAVYLAIMVTAMPGFTVGDLRWLPGLLVLSTLLLTAAGTVVMFFCALTRRTWLAAAVGWVLFGTGAGVWLLEQAEALTGLALTRFSLMEGLRGLSMESLSGGQAAATAAVALGVAAVCSLVTCLVLDRRDVP